MNYQVKIENFEGPMDLLLFFIQRDQLNIYDIPIAHITSEFLESFGLKTISDLPKLKELSNFMDDYKDPVLFGHNHALE